MLRTIEFNPGLWTLLAGLAIAPAWLLPNHTLPWLSFHAEAWMAVVLMPIAAYAVAVSNEKTPLHAIGALALLLSTVPLVQFAFKLIPFFGTAWINSIYLLGTAVGLIVGSTYEKESPGRLADILFLAVGVASIVSLALQLYQWLGLEIESTYVLYSGRSRYFGNLAQPNQLASLLVLGVLACAWGYVRNYLRGPLTVTMAIALLFGVALTESRTALLNCILLCGLCLIWRERIPRRVTFSTFCLLALLIAMVIGLPNLNEWLDSNGIGAQFRNPAGDLRLTIWAMYLQALTIQPWFGFGWGQLIFAQYLFIDDIAPLSGNVFQSHNLLLDLLLWNGIPLGIAIIGFLTWSFALIVKKIKSLEQVLAFGFIFVLVVHAMLEYPLHYAYFLLPAAVMAGVLSHSVRPNPSFEISKRVFGLLVLAAFLTLCVTLRDYFKVEASFYGLRFELKKIQSDFPKTPPDVLALTHMKRSIELAREPIRGGRTDADLKNMEDLVQTLPSEFLLYRTAKQFAYNDKPLRAQHWLKVICHISSPEYCEKLYAKWLEESVAEPQLRSTPSPVTKPKKTVE